MEEGVVLELVVLLDEDPPAPHLREPLQLGLSEIVPEPSVSVCAGCISITLRIYSYERKFKLETLFLLIVDRACSCWQAPALLKRGNGKR